MGINLFIINMCRISGVNLRYSVEFNVGLCVAVGKCGNMWGIGVNIRICGGRLMFHMLG